MAKLYQAYRVVFNNGDNNIYGYIPFCGSKFLDNVKQDLKKKEIFKEEFIQRVDYAMSENENAPNDGELPSDCNNWVPFNELGVNVLSLLPGAPNELAYHGYIVKNNFVHNLFGYPQFMVNILWENFSKENKELEKAGKTIYGEIRKIAENDRHLREVNSIFHKRNIWAITTQQGDYVGIYRFIAEMGPNFNPNSIEKEIMDNFIEKANKTKNVLEKPDLVKLIPIYELEASQFKYVYEIMYDLDATYSSNKKDLLSTESPAYLIFNEIKNNLELNILQKYAKTEESNV